MGWLTKKLKNPHTRQVARALLDEESGTVVVVIDGALLETNVRVVSDYEKGLYVRLDKTDEQLLMPRRT
jgi:hypothetical protein